MNTMIYSPSGASAGIGFAVPSDTVRRVVNQLVRHGRVIRPSLGLAVFVSPPTSLATGKLRSALECLKSSIRSACRTTAFLPNLVCEESLFSRSFLDPGRRTLGCEVSEKEGRLSCSGLLG